MAIPVSTVPAVKNYLVTNLTAGPNSLAAVTGYGLGVFYDRPNRYLPEDIVVVGDVHRQVSVLAMVGGGGQDWLEEVYQVDITTSIFRAGDYAQTCYERAWTLTSGVESLIRSDPSLGGLVVEARPGVSTDATEWVPESKGRLCEVVLQVHVTATL